MVRRWALDENFYRLYMATKAFIVNLTIPVSTLQVSNDMELSNFTVSIAIILGVSITTVSGASFSV